MATSEPDLIEILMVTSDKQSLSNLASAFEDQGGIQLSQAESGAEALDIITGITFHLVVADEKLSDMTGLEFAGKLVKTNPMMNCTVVSPLSPEDFHEASEGLGLLMPLPPNPGKEAADELLKCLNKILTLTKA